MNTVPFKFFRQNLSKLLREAKDESVHFSRLGIVYEVKKCALPDNFTTKVCTNLEATEVPTQKPHPSWGRGSSGFNEYGCGCKKTEGKVFCGKHGRQ